MSIIYFFDLLEEVWIFVWHFFFKKFDLNRPRYAKVYKRFPHKRAQL